ncbi:MAG: alanine dehydrogenase, partial [Patescibacteria group bacterium]
MIIVGVPKEIKNNEYRIAIMPEQVALIDKKRAKVWIEKGAGEGAGFSDEEYRAAGAG